MKSPHAKSPFSEVIYVFLSTVAIPFSVFILSFEGRRDESDCWLTAGIIQSAFILKFEPSIGTGLFLPSAPGSPNLFFIHSISETLSLSFDMIFTGATRN